MTIRNLDQMFRPASVAVFGASDREGSLGAVVLRKLKQAGFAGPIWPVNPKHRQVQGEPAWPDVASLPAAPELAVVCTPAVAVPGLIDELGRRGTRAAIVITAGLKQPQQPGHERTLEQAMLEAARPYLLRILGPNCIGALVPGVSLNASFAPAQALKGPLAFVTQSGALATAMLDWANERGIGFSHFVSLGDSADVDFGDLLDYLGSDADTRAILLYIESVKNARKFMSAARAAARNKPVILVKAGRAPEGAKAAASHTGALAGSDQVFDAAVQRAGLLRVGTLEALFDAAETLSHLHGGWRRHVGSQAGRLAILTNGGGAGVLAADALSVGGGQLASLAPDTLAALDACLPATWSRGNPVDIIGDAPVERYQAALRVLLAAPEVDGVVFIHAPTAIVAAGEIAAACLPQMQASLKPLLLSWLGGSAVAGARQATRTAGLPSYATPERAVDAWLQMVHYENHQEALRQLVSAQVDIRPDRSAIGRLLGQAREEGRAWLGDAATQSLLSAYGIPTVATERTSDLQHALQAAGRMGYPVALKIISPQVVHKTDVGGVALDLRNAEELSGAARRMRQQLQALRPEAEFAGFTVQAMVARPGAHELILGLNTDPVFGPVLLLGEGGVNVELRAHHAVALPPLNAHLAADLVRRSGLSRLLAGHRGRPAAHLDALHATLLKLSQLAVDLSDVVELDINPLLVDEHGVLALDARARLRPLAQAPALPAIRPYPAELEDTVPWSQGRVWLRPIRPEDGERLARFYAKASPADLRLRFFTARREVPRSELARYSQIDYDREMTFIALPSTDPDAPMLGEVRGLCDPDNVCAEFAIQVAGTHQGRGLGRLLLEKLIAYLRARGTTEVVGECLIENQRLEALARHLGFEVSASAEAGILSLRLTLNN